jgi:hypothetical protein
MISEVGVHLGYLVSTRPNLRQKKIWSQQLKGSFNRAIKSKRFLGAKPFRQLATLSTVNLPNKKTWAQCNETIFKVTVQNTLHFVMLQMQA